MTSDDSRKQRERDYHDLRRYQSLAPRGGRDRSCQKWYFAGKDAHTWLYSRVQSHRPDCTLLDYGCGSGETSIALAQMGYAVTGIDISSSRIETARAAAERLRLSVAFRVADAEKTDFEDGSFDLVVCRSALHHLDLARGYREIGRILKDDGVAIAVEPLGHNPLINWYRDRTPSMRSPDERPLRMQDVRMAKRYFGSVDLSFFSLATLAAAPLWQTPLGASAVRIMSGVDRVLLRLPLLQSWAWTVGMVLSRPVR